MLTLTMSHTGSLHSACHDVMLKIEEVKLTTRYIKVTQVPLQQHKLFQVLLTKVYRQTFPLRRWLTMAMRSGWDTIFAEPIRWRRNEAMKKCWDHIKYTLVAVVSIMMILWFTQGHRYLYNVLYGPFVLSEQEIVDTRPENMWKQYVQINHGVPLDPWLLQTEVDCDGDKCKPMILQFKKRAAHNKNINQLVIKRPISQDHPTYSLRHQINFSVMSVKKLKAIIGKIGLTKNVLPGMEKTELVSVITKAYDSNPTKFNKNTYSEVLVGFLTDFDVMNVYRKPEFMALVLNISDPYFAILSLPSLFVSLYVYFVMKIVYYISKFVKIWMLYLPSLTSFGSTKCHKQILRPLEHIIRSGDMEGSTSLSVYDFVALKLQQEIFSSDEFEASKIVCEEYFRLFVTKKHVIYVRNDVVYVISISQIARIRAWSDTCDVVVSSGASTTLNISPDQARHMKILLSLRSARFRQLEEQRRAKKQQQVLKKALKDRAFKLNVDSEGYCAICLGDMKQGQMVIPFLCPAEHQFHDYCMLDSLKHGYSCPLCRHQATHKQMDDYAYLGTLQLVFT